MKVPSPATLKRSLAEGDALLDGTHAVPGERLRDVLRGIVECIGTGRNATGLWTLDTATVASGPTGAMTVIINAPAVEVNRLAGQSHGEDGSYGEAIFNAVPSPITVGQEIVGLVISDTWGGITGYDAFIHGAPAPIGQGRIPTDEQIQKQVNANALNIGGELRDVVWSPMLKITIQRTGDTALNVILDNTAGFPDPPTIE